MAAGDLPGGTDSALARDLTADLQAASSATTHEQRRLSERVAKIRRERYMWADMAMAGSVPADIAREKQQALAEQLTTAETALARLSVAHDSHKTSLEGVRDPRVHQ